MTRFGQKMIVRAAFVAALICSMGLVARANLLAGEGRSRFTEMPTTSTVVSTETGHGRLVARGESASTSSEVELASISGSSSATVAVLIVVAPSIARHDTEKE